MIELSVENLHLTYGDNPVLKGGVHDARPGGGSIAAGAFGKRENHAAAGGGRAGKTDERTDRHRQPHGVRRHAAQRDPGRRA